jgi:DNA-binding XRE family transcriptional regulator
LGHRALDTNIAPFIEAGRGLVKTIYSEEYAHLLLLLRRKRLEAKLTQAQLANKLGVQRTLIGKCERGERRIDVIELQSFCNALGTELQAFIAELKQRQQRR